MAMLNPTVTRAEVIERMTHDEFMEFAPEDRKAELIEGVLIVASPAFEPHEDLFGFLFAVLRSFTSQLKLGRVLGSRYAVYISETETYEPDILFVAADRAHLITEKKLTGAPDLVIEILSAGTARFDRGVKRENYDRAGVRELWLIDPYGPAGTQFYQRREGRLVEIAPVDGIINSVAIPGFKLNIAWLWPKEGGELPSPIAVLKELGVI
ncbi:MAG: Uma2 family endonuclease [Chloroflexi bacterium]|nr:Uma2 family endonuclease [Chloroflexota bacterium]